jgi:hypothetical protein
VLQPVLRTGLLKGKTIGIDPTTLEGTAAMRSIARRDTTESYTEESYSEYLPMGESRRTGSLRRSGHCGGDPRQRGAMRSG